VRPCARTSTRKAAISASAYDRTDIIAVTICFRSADKGGSLFFEDALSARAGAAMINIFRSMALLCLLTTLSSGVAQSQEFPSRPVSLVVPNVAGGSMDILARLFSTHLEALWKQPVLVIYKPGAGTAVGTDFVAKSAPDGYTIGLVVTSHLINPSIRPDLPFDTVKDLSGVTMTAISHLVIEATPSLPVKTLSDLIAYAKKNPGKLTYATAGSGSSMHLAGELLKTKTGIDMMHIPYKGSAPAYPDVMSGRVDLMIDPLYSSIPLLDTGRLRPIAIASSKRAQTSPDIPTAAETIPGFAVQSINGIVVPKATPREIVNKLHDDFATILARPELQTRMAELGLEIVTMTPEAFDDYIRTQIAQWAEVVRISGAKSE
jgi:tripartite-type tricarboxylate transporter receptor subunit TctC